MISKSSYVNYFKCPKRFYLHLYKSNLEAPIDALGLRNIEDGNLVGNLALSYFPNTYNASYKSEEGVIDIAKQIKNTKEALEKDVDCIAEASFSIDELFCAVDLLKKDGFSYSIYEVKSNKDLKEKHFVDVAYQKYVLEKCGIKIKDVYILHPNKDYVRHGELDIYQYFKKDKVTDNPLFITASNEAINNIDEVIKIYHAKDEPTVAFNKGCSGSDGKCPFYEYCHKDIPKDSIKNINGLRNVEKLYNEGIITIDDLLKTNPNLNNRQQVQINAYINKKDVSINKNEITSFLSSLRYPLYYLDFETTSDIIPQFDDMHPGESYPFQYSLHIEMSPDGEVIHKEFLGEELNCIRALAEQLVKDIPVGACSIAFHNATEKQFVRYLANKFPDLKNELLSINLNMLDLLDPFKNGYYYNLKQGGSNSIKYVMPALCPKMEDAYHKLPVVHNGAEALSMFKTLVTTLKDKEEYVKVRQGMLDYCCLDTLSMVEIMKVLRNSIK